MKPKKYGISGLRWFWKHAALSKAKRFKRELLQSNRPCVLCNAREIWDTLLSPGSPCDLLLQPRAGWGLGPRCGAWDSRNLNFLGSKWPWLASKCPGEMSDHAWETRQRGWEAAEKLPGSAHCWHRWATTHLGQQTHLRTQRSDTAPCRGQPRQTCGSGRPGQAELCQVVGSPDF